MRFSKKFIVQYFGLVIILLKLTNLFSQIHSNIEGEYFYQDHDLRETIRLQTDSFHYSLKVGLINFEVLGIWEIKNDEIHLKLNTLPEEENELLKIESNEKLYEDIFNNSKFRIVENKLIQLNQRNKPRKVKYIVSEKGIVKVSKTKREKKFIKMDEKK